MALRGAVRNPYQIHSCCASQVVQGILAAAAAAGGAGALTTAAFSGAVQCSSAGDTEGEKIEAQLQRVLSRLDRVQLHLGAGPVEVEEQRRNMLAVAYEFCSSGARVGYLIAGNAGKVGGGLLKFDKDRGSYDFWVSSWRPLAQEEGSLNNFLNADHAIAQAALLRAVPKWGMEVLDSTSARTKQGVDYTVRATTEAETERQVRFKYRRCLKLGAVTGFSEEFDQPWDSSKPFRCHLYITAGPMARCPDTAFRRPLRPDQSMRRTFDPNANKNQAYLREAIKEAIAASLQAMDGERVTVAIVPGLSTGVYAPSVAIGKQLRSEYLQLVADVVATLDLKHIQRVIYCNK